MRLRMGGGDPQSFAYALATKASTVNLKAKSTGSRLQVPSPRVYSAYEASPATWQQGSPRVPARLLPKSLWDYLESR